MDSPALTTLQAELIASDRLSMSVASRDMRRVPSLSRALGCRVAPDRTRLTLFLQRMQSRQLLQDIAATQAVAVVFSLPSTNLTFQVKGRDAAETALQDGDVALCAAHREAFAQEILPHGYALELARAVHDFDPGQLVAVGFSVSDVFEQTPGPGAGARVGTTP
jgi:hypothetical protein